MAVSIFQTDSIRVGIVLWVALLLWVGGVVCGSNERKKLACLLLSYFWQYKMLHGFLGFFASVLESHSLAFY